MSNMKFEDVAILLADVAGLVALMLSNSIYKINDIICIYARHP